MNNTTVYGKHVTVIMPEKIEKQNKYQLAIETMEISAKHLKQRIELSFSPHKTNVFKHSNKWKLEFMGQVFVEDDFIQTVGDAMKLAYKVIK